MKTSKFLAAAAAALALAGTAEASLVDRGGGLIYDTTRNITWLADMNYALTSHYAGATNVGKMFWATANQWAADLNYGGYSDWRLPTLDPADTTCSSGISPGNGFPTQHLGFNCAGGELSGLFVTDFGGNNDGSGVITSDDTAEQIANRALFSNVQPFYGYWSATPYAPDQVGAWYFTTGIDAQSWANKSSGLYAVAVRSGDVAGAVPEPQTLALVLLALGASRLARGGRGAAPLTPRCG